MKTDIELLRDMLKQMESQQKQIDALKDNIRDLNLALSHTVNIIHELTLLTKKNSESRFF